MTYFLAFIRIWGIMDPKLSLVFPGIFLTATLILGAQETASPKKIEEHTLLERFDPDLVQPVSEQERLRDARIVRAEKAAEIIDTMSISESKRRRLFRDLASKPYSDRLSEIMAETKFEDRD